MARYLEYETLTGHIISEFISSSMPDPVDGISYLAIDDNLLIDTASFAVKNGVLVKLYETNEERIQREHIRQEQSEKVRNRVKSMCYELCLAKLDNNDTAIKELQKEFQELKVLL